MPYRVRAFCMGPEVPRLAPVFDFAKEQGVVLSADDSHGPTDVNTPDWTDVEISYNSDKSPLVVQCNRDDDTDDCLARVEPHAYVELIGSPGLSRAKRQVIQHLNATRFIGASQLLGDVEDDGFEANSIFLEYFVQHCGGTEI